MTATQANVSHCLLILMCCSLRVLFAIKIIDVLIPEKAIIHSIARIKCHVDLEEDTLYSLKWYLNGTEVASFMPIRNQSHEVFSSDDVPISFASEGSDLMIRDVSWSCEGTWICEVFADMSFQKDEKIAQMVVIAPPAEIPVIRSNSDVYDMGDVVNVTCSSPPAKPLPRVSWLINGEPAPPEFVSEFENMTGTQLVFPIQVQHLLDGKPRIQITCEASFNYNYSSFETLETKELEIGSNASSSSSPVRITGLQAGYVVGDEMRLTCSYRGEEEVVMHWLLNDRRVRPRLVIRYKFHNYIGLKMRIEKRDLNHRNEISVRCVASQFLLRVKRKTSSSAKRLISRFLTHIILTSVILLVKST